MIAALQTLDDLSQRAISDFVDRIAEDLLHVRRTRR
jgi:hypothetical protein